MRGKMSDWLSVWSWLVFLLILVVYHLFMRKTDLM
jgi:hypothetical protein